MSDQLQTLREDLGFIRAVAEDTGPPFQRDGLILVAAGLLWGLPAIAGWAYLRGFLDVPVSLMRATLYLPAPLMLIATLYLIRRFPRGTAGVTSRAMSAAWAGLGWSAAAGVAALLAASFQLKTPRVWLLITTLAFALYGLAWSVAYVAKRRGSYAVIAAGCLVMTVLTGVLVATHELWLAFGLGLLILVAAPGFVMAREARSVHGNDT